MKKKKAKWLSYAIDGVLLALIAFFGYVQISMLVTKSGNHGVPMAFGSSFLYVSTNSMDSEKEKWQGQGIIIQKVKPAELKISKPIYNDQGQLIDYDDSGDVVTFYYKTIMAPDTHRLVDIDYNEETKKYSFRTMGDNPEAHQKMRTETWGEDDLIGKVVAHSEGFGSLLTLISPDAAASAGKTAWLLPVAVLVPLVLLAGLSIFDVFKEARRKQKEEDAAMEQAMLNAGIDLSDEVAVETFRAKEEYKMEYRAKLAEETERAKKEALKQLKKRKKEGGNKP